MEVTALKKNYGKKQVLKGIELSASWGSCIGIIGGNGSGKSTFLSILAGVLKCDCGKFLVSGENLFENEKKRNAIVGYVPQGTPLIEELSARDNLSLWYEKDQMEKSLENGVLKMLGVGDFLKTRVCKMSGGMKKRLSIGCSVANNPQILLMDEPSAALDIVCKEKINEYISQFKASGGIVILATHDAGELPLCDNIYILKDGVLSPFEYDGDIQKLARSL
ncbi:MAG: ATP-binding cassette domain-containing protein [Ruminococcaceae bacterium]|nr:ATP-binding cassette domain-containing protein [Oscillospiraceae bacterium]